MVEGLADGQWALISKVHHCMVDGVSGADLMASLLDPSRDAAAARTRRHGRRRPNRATPCSSPSRSVSWSPTRPSRSGPCVRSCARRDEPPPSCATTLDGLRSVGHAADASPGAVDRGRHRPPSTVGRGARRARRHQGDQADVRRDGQRRRPGRDRRRLPRPARRPDPRIPITPWCARSCRCRSAEPETGAPSNQVSAMIAELPIGIADPVERLASMRAADGAAQAVRPGRDDGAAHGARRSRRTVAAGARAQNRRRDGPRVPPARHHHRHHERARAAVPAVRRWPPDGRLPPLRAARPRASASAWRSCPTTAGSASASPATTTPSPT